MTNLDYTVLHDNGKKICLIGNTFISKQLFAYFNSIRPVENVLYEEVLNQTDQWRKERQFIFPTSDIALKLNVITQLNKKQIHWCSVVSKFNSIGNNVSIGHNVYISSWNSLLDNVSIGNHTVLTDQCTLSHNVIIEDFCHIGPQGYFVFCKIGQGSYIASKSSFLGRSTFYLETLEYCNYIVASTVTKKIEVPGTYYGNRRIDTNTSLDRKID